MSGNVRYPFVLQQLAWTQTATVTLVNSILITSFLRGPAPFSEPFPLEESLSIHKIPSPDSKIDIQNAAPSTSSLAPVSHILCLIPITP